MVSTLLLRSTDLSTDHVHQVMHRFLPVNPMSPVDNIQSVRDYNRYIIFPVMLQTYPGNVQLGIFWKVVFEHAVMLIFTTHSRYVIEDIHKVILCKLMVLFTVKENRRDAVLYEEFGCNFSNIVINLTSLANVLCIVHIIAHSK